ncbi:GspH/FimT family pseudopilin [Acinetobacter sp. ANC 4173]|jgi:prepilin-type N-terminal cleavage/methylation domain-containing protein|uniref:GspH/FimT family pseudopilin n=1 Tax=Acinetobacter sp. ANC 4173 TaxID=2529837 RepID=UPI00103D2E46|nr:GspH/FimT family pseudopilin [Acinetobacter sp. ANC 4173]TCB78545.1 prepilin-type N-terminal cleavage/methylation domain-containing protein [Acinetobacter sp. ANC 4173]
MHINKHRAYTLIELVITILVLSILVTLALPYYHEMKANQERRTIFRQIVANIQLAKQHAAIHHTNVVMCSSQNMQSCKEEMWEQGFILFLDFNQNRQLDLNETLITQEHTNLSYGTLNWRGTLHFPSLNFMAEHGLPIGSNGSFYYCSSTVKHMKIILNKMGNSRSIDLSNC